MVFRHCSTLTGSIACSAFFLCLCFSVFSQETRFLVKFSENVPGMVIRNSKTDKEQLFGHLQPGYSVKSLRQANDTVSALMDKWAVVVVARKDSQLIRTELESTGLFDYIEPDYQGFAAGISGSGSIPDDPGFPDQWYLHNNGSFSLAPSVSGADIQMTEAWQVTTGDSSVTVAVLDSGIDFDIAEFKGRIWHNPQELSDGIDNDNNGLTDDIYGWDFINDDAVPGDDNGHGTAVTGILAASGNNGYGFAGIDWKCKLMVCKVVDENLSGYYSQWISGIYYAVDHGARIINFSLAGKEPSKALEEAVAYAYNKGVLVVASMNNLNASQPYYPAAYEPVIAIGATDPDDKRSTAFNGNPQYGSNYGNHIDVVAPGNYITGLSKSFSGTRMVWAGTSMSTPMVSGIASLLLAQEPFMRVEEIKSLIYNSAEDGIGTDREDTPGWDPYYGYGRVNAYRALSADTTFLDIQWNIFPNPAVTEFYIEYKLKEINSPFLSMVDMQGRVVWKTREGILSRNEKLPVDVNNIPAGIYLVVLKFGINSLSRKVIIIH